MNRDEIEAALGVVLIVIGLAVFWLVTI